MSTGYFATIEGHHIRPGPDGATVFCPDGGFGQVGYVIPDAATERSLRRAIRVFYIALIAVIPVTVMSGWFPFDAGGMTPGALVLFLLASFPVGFALFRLYFWPFTRRLQPVLIERRVLGSWRMMGQTMSPRLLTLTCVFSVLMVFLFLYFYRRSGDATLLVFAGAFALLLGVPYGMAAWYRATRS